jgi:nicotinamide mononucleotide transporter
MADMKVDYKKIIETCFMLFVILLMLVQAILRQDNPVALISAICGITYTFIAGKGNPICYLFGVTGSGFYCLLSFHNHLWGNLLLYAAYYLPMQVLGFFKWNKHLKKGENSIEKIQLRKKEFWLLVLLLTVISLVFCLVLTITQDKHPILDSFTTVFSIGGMYLTVRRAVEQWIFWIGVNSLSLLLWSKILMTGSKVYSTVFMWGVYLLLAVYFYFEWMRDIKGQTELSQN